MRRLLTLGKQAFKRVNARIAILVVVLAAGGVAVWQGYAHMAAKSKDTGPTRQIATGLTSEASLDPTLKPGGAGSTNGQGAGGTQRPYQLTGYGQDAGGAQPPANPYLPSSSDPAGGSSGSPYSSSPAAVPENPYRASTSDGAPAYGSLNDSPYAGASDQTADAAQQPASAAPAESADPVAAYADRYGSAGTQSYGASSRNANAIEPPAMQPPADPTAATETTDAATLAAPTTTPATSVPSSSPNPYTSNPYLSSPRELPTPSANPLPAAPGAGQLAAATPGERQLEGPQQPAIALEKFSPAEIQVGKPATFEMLVRNTGAIPAQNVVVSDHVPAGTQLVDAKPQPRQAADGSLVWTLGTLQPGEEVAISLEVMPQTEGEIGSTAHVTFAATATSRSICTRPQLAIEHTAPPKVLIGESITVGITVSNSGTGAATGVIIEEDVPEGLAHVAGPQLEYEVGTLRPGESKRLELSLKADKAGLIQNTIHVRGDANLAAQHSVQVEVIAPQLSVDVDGPKRRFLERQATYTLSVANPGTAPARDVELVAFLPRGMKFVDTDSQGQYDPAQHAVFWSLEELPPSKAGAVKLTTLPIEPGEQRLRIESRASLGLTAENEQVVQVEQSAELVHSINDLEEVIEVGSETTYEVRVTNAGTKAATNIRVAAVLPPEMQALGGEGPTRAEGDAQKVVFEPLARLNPQEEVVFKIQVKGLKPGDHLVRVQLASDEWPTPVTREESTRVYEDR